MKDAFCSNEQKITSHKVAVDGNGEFVFTCSTKDCGRFFKLPSNTEDFDKALKAEEAGSKGQVSVEAQEKKLAALLSKVGVKSENPEE